MSSTQFVQFWLATSAKSGVTKKLKPRKSDNSLICPDDLTGVIASSFGMWGDNVDVITSAKCCVDRFSGFRVLTPPIFPFSIGLAGRPYNSVSTTVLHCEALLLKQLFHLANNYKKTQTVVTMVITVTIIEFNVNVIVNTITNNHHNSLYT